MSARLIRIAAVYLAIGVTMGIVMGITHQFVLAPVHAHINLLGWASLAIIGVVYHVYPAAAATRLARVHFWMHNIALPVFMVGVGFVVTGHEAAMPVAIAGALTVAIGILVFVANIFMTIRPADATATLAQAVRASA
jgi:cbb3-type cytochrome oxidase subunit 1